jgi:hypothetical protein
MAAIVRQLTDIVRVQHEALAMVTKSTEYSCMICDEQDSIVSALALSAPIVKEEV